VSHKSLRFFVLTNKICISNLRLNTNIPPTLELYTPTLSTTTWSFPSHHSPVAAPLTPPHPLLVTQPLTRLQKSLQGAVCCFCAESLEYTLVGEKIVVFECAHTSHYECLIQLVDQPQAPRQADQIESFMPPCPVCGEVCVPLDESILANIVHPNNSDRADRAMPTRKWSSISDSEVSNFSHLSQSSVSSADSFDTSLNRPVVTTPASPSVDSANFHFSSPAKAPGASSAAILDIIHNITTSAVFETAPAIPSVVLRARTTHIPTVEIDTTPEFATAIAGEYITTAVTVRAPPVPAHYSSTAEPPASIVDRRAATERVHDLVPDWKQLDFARFGLLRFVDTCHVASKREGPWRLLDCYLFETMLVLVRSRGSSNDKKRSCSGASQTSVAMSMHSVSSTSSFITFSSPPSVNSFSSGSALVASAPPVVRGTVALKEHLASVSVSSKTGMLTLNLTTPELPNMHLRFPGGLAALENWYAALIDEQLVFPLSRLTPPVLPAPNLGAAMAAKMKPLPSIIMPSSLKLPLDTVVLVPLLSGGGPAGSKFTALRYALKAFIAEMSLFDRLAIVPYGSSNCNEDAPDRQCHALAPRCWRHWGPLINALAPAATPRTGTKADLTNGIAAALAVLAARKTRNPITSVIVILDSSLASGRASWSGASGPLGSSEGASPSSLHYRLHNHFDTGAETASIDNELLKRAAAAGVALHGLGVGAGHCAEVLRVLAPDSYGYVRRWAELSAMLVGLHRGLAAAAHCDVVVRITARTGTIELTGEPRSANYYHRHFYRQNMMMLESPPLEPFSEFALDNYTESCRHHDVKMGMMMMGESRTFLVQTPVPALGELFDVTVSSLGQPERASGKLPHIAAVRLADPRDPRRLARLGLPTSIIYGSPLAHVRVSQRRLQLAAIRALDALAHFPGLPPNSGALPATASSMLAFIASLRSTLLTQPYVLTDRGTSTSTSTDTAMLSEVARLVDVLDALCAEAVAARDGNRSMFEQDVRKLLLQSVDVLDKERAYTLRTPLESLFLQRQVLNNVW
jgi:hypothetical protein